MNVKVEEVSSIRRRLSFEVGAEQVDAAIAGAYAEIARTAKLKGFRKGKIPQRILEQYFRPQMEEKVVTKLISDSYFQALVDHKVPAVGQPEITESGDIDRGKAFTYVAEVEVKPEVEAKDYTGLEVKKEKFEFDPAVVDHRLEEMRQMRVEQKVTSRKKAREGDFVTIDFEGFVDGEAFDGGSAEGHVLELGSGSFIPGFEEQIVGMKREEEKEIEVTFPEEYGNKELAGKKAVFKVKLHEIKEKVLPGLDDDFAREFGAESLEDLRQKMTENFQQQEKSRIEGDLRERLVEALVAKNPIEVPEAMVAKQLEYMLQNVRNRMQQQGMTLEMLGMNEEVFASLYRDTAVKQVQGSLLLEAIGRQEGIEVADDEIEGKFEEIAAMANAPVDAVRQYYSSDEARATLKDQILEEKTLAFLIDNAKIVEVGRQELEAEKAQAETEEATEA
ncbi:trigger factor [Geothermobacter ehrlichii]|uniref:Trigger factor n=2 Tax=Geothermobacter ehrlichii TaxID=213224 RepID=A0A5D3WN23_9BACT|nr:trigger factor [Geothermobacter ehrlichii]